MSMARLIPIWALLLLGWSCAFADDVRPVTLQIHETEPGRVSVQWRVPRVLPAHAIPEPVLPANCTPVGPRTFQGLPAAWLSRQEYECDGTIAGLEVGLEYPYHNPSMSTLLRVELLSGERHAQVLGPGEPTWRIPASQSDWLKQAQINARAGLSHVFTHWIHMAFLLALLLFGDFVWQCRLITAFSVGQLVAALALMWPQLTVSAVYAEAMLGLAVVVLAANAIQLRAVTLQIFVVAALTGVVHGLGLLQPMTDAGQATVGSYLVQVLAMDTGHLSGAALLTGVVYLLSRALGRFGAARPLAYVTGSAAFAFVLWVTLLMPASLNGREARARTQLPAMDPTQASPSTPPSSQRLASGDLLAPIQSFVSIEPFEVRHEVLLRVETLKTQLGIARIPSGIIDTTAQARIREAAAQFVLEHTQVMVDGQLQAPAVVRVDFMERTTQGLFPRSVPIPEEMAQAQVGVILSLLVPGVPNRVSLAWMDLPGLVETVPVTISDPEVTRTLTLVPGATPAQWNNELLEDPIPTVDVVRVRPRKLDLPLVSIPLVLVVLVLVVMGIRGRHQVRSFTIARIALVLALLAGPLARASVALPSAMQAVPAESEARRITSALLGNIYRAFESREESAVFDRLAVSVTGEALRDIYLEHRTALELQERGGATARVDAVDVREVQSLEAAEAGGFSLVTDWTVAGAVTHFGHRHYRKNSYSAVIWLIPDGQDWKVAGIEVLSEERLL